MSTPSLTHGLLPEQLLTPRSVARLMSALTLPPVVVPVVPPAPVVVPVVAEGMRPEPVPAESPVVEVPLPPPDRTAVGAPERGLSPEDEVLGAPTSSTAGA